MASRIVFRHLARQRLLAIGLSLAGALGAAWWAFSTLLAPANLLEMVRMASLC